jgi:oxygen-independent coproporphyrinogen III oxidase
MSGEPFSLYIHVPFCSQKCPYCDFNTYAVPSAPEDQYVPALLAELDGYASDRRFAGRELKSIFFGGGTPSLLSPAAIGSVIERATSLFPLQSCAEVTIEANPGQPSQERYEQYRAAGVNRISFGVQSFDAQRLSLLGREHSPDDARRAVADALAAGIANVSVDIIFGVPGQSVQDLEQDLRLATDLPISHLSTYALSIEPGTPFFQRQERGLLKLPPDERVAEMLEILPKRLAERGFARYEISNFAKPGHESVHNSAYWSGGDYVGIGAGAHSFVAQYENGQRVSAERWSNFALPTVYAERVRSSAVSWKESLNREALMFEFFYLGLRRAGGVSSIEFSRLFGQVIPAKIAEAIEELVSDGFIERAGELIALSERGIALSDSVFERMA